MQWKDLRILIVLVLLAYLITLALTGPTARVLPPPQSTRTPRPTFASREPSPIARILAPTSTPRPTKAAVAAATPFPSPVPITPTVTAVASPTPPPIATHVVKAGETLTGIARRYGIPIQVLVEANGLTNPDRLLLGQVLVLPSPGEPSPATPVTPSPTAPVVVTHVVKAGENLTGIARDYGIPIQAIVEANGLTNPDRLLAGQVLILPQPEKP